MKVFTPVCWEGDESIDALTLSLAEKLRFESYSRDENVMTEGSIIRAMYFVIKGHLKMQSVSMLHRPLGLRDGSYFGERGLLGCTISVYTVRTVRACDILSLSSEAFAQVLQKHPFTRLALKLCERAYKHLKEQSLVDCSRNDMEDHWGAAILHTLQDVQTCHERMGAKTAKEEVAENGVDDTGALTSELPTASSFIANEVLPLPDKSAADVQTNATNEPAADELMNDACGIDRAFGELPTHVEDMFETLTTPQSSFEAFAPLLHILLPTDPLDWKASFSASYSLKIREMQTASVAPEPTTPPAAVSTPSVPPPSSSS